MAIAVSKIPYKRLAEILGLPKHVKRFAIKFGVNDVVAVECEYYPECEAKELVDAVVECVSTTAK